MHNRQILTICLAIFIISATGLVMAGEDEGETQCIPLGVITLSAPGSVKAKRSPVDFPHSSHFGISCMRCHHNWDGFEQIESCTGCHDLEEAPPKENSDEAIMYYKQAFHALCIGCHKEIAIANAEIAKTYTAVGSKTKPAGPTGCVGCHPKDN